MTNPFPERIIYHPGDELPDDIDLTVTVGPWWTVVAADQTWNHVGVMSDEWSEAAGHWVPVPDNQVRLIVCDTSGTTVRHPELDNQRYPNAAAAWRAAWDAGLLNVIVFPGRRRTPA